MQMLGKWAPEALAEEEMEGFVEQEPASPAACWLMSYFYLPRAAWTQQMSPVVTFLGFSNAARHPESSGSELDDKGR